MEAERTDEKDNEPRPLITSLGLAIIDDIHFGDGSSVTYLLGGSGSFCTAGARLFCDGPKSRAVAWVLHAGHDFPPALEFELSTWQIDLTLRKTQEVRSTRGHMIYADGTSGCKFEFSICSRSYANILTDKRCEYKMPVLQVLPRHLHGSRTLKSKALHFLASPTALLSQMEELEQLHASSNKEQEQSTQLIIWEPAPLSCRPEHLVSCFEAARKVDVFSPNHIELQAFFGISAKPFNATIVETLATAFLASGVGKSGDGIILVRAGEHGSLLNRYGTPPYWQQPYYRHDLGTAHPRIVDTTGTGNAFLGGFAVGLDETNDHLEAMRYGTVAASFMIEQIGLPTLTVNEQFGTELWNGDRPRRRLEMLKARDEQLVIEIDD